MTGKNKAILTILGVVVLAIVSVGIYGWSWLAYLDGHADGSAQQLANQMFFQVAFFRKMQRSPSDVDMATIEQHIRKRIRQNWEELELMVRSDGVEVKGFDALKNLVEQSLGGSAAAEGGSGDAQN